MFLMNFSINFLMFASILNTLICLINAIHNQNSQNVAKYLASKYDASM